MTTTAEQLNRRSGWVPTSALRDETGPGVRLQRVAGGAIPARALLKYNASGEAIVADVHETAVQGINVQNQAVADDGTLFMARNGLVTGIAASLVSIDAPLKAYKDGQVGAMITAANAGGTIDTTLGSSFANQPANDTVEVVSDSTADSGQVVRVYGTRTGGTANKIYTEDLTLNGTTAVLTTVVTDWDEMLAFEFVSGTAPIGTISLRENSGSAVIDTIAAGGSANGVTNVPLGDRDAFVGYCDAVADAGTTKRVGIWGTDENGDAVGHSVALTGAVAVQIAQLFTTVTKILSGDVEVARTSTVKVDATVDPQERHIGRAMAAVTARGDSCSFEIRKLDVLGAVNIEVKDSAGSFSGTDVEAVLAELYTAATTAGSDAITDTGTYYTTDTVDAAFDALGAQIGGDDDATKAFTTGSIVTDDDDLYTCVDKLDIGMSKMVWLMPVYGVWAVDGDNSRTNGGGIAGGAGAATDLVTTLTSVGAAFCSSFDVTDAVYAPLATNSSLTGWAGDYQLTSDAASEEVGEYTVYGADVPFCQLAFDLSALATWAGDGGVWEYWNGAWTAIPVGTFYDAMDTTDETTGVRSFQQVGAFTFLPPSDWATSTENGQLGYYIRYRITAAQVTQTPVLNSVQADLGSPTDGWVVPHKGVISVMHLEDGAGTLHSTTDVQFFLMNFTTGATTAMLTFPQDKRRDTFTGLSLAVADGDVLGIVTIIEDGVAEVTNAMLSLEVAYLD